MVEFRLPGEGERDTMIRMYIDKYLKAPPPTASARRIVVDESLSDAHVAAAVEATNGFSGREISKLAIRVAGGGLRLGRSEVHTRDHGIGARSAR